MSSLKLGQALLIRTAESAQDVYRSRVVESTHTDYLIDPPIHREQHTPLSLAPHGELWVEYHALDGALCRFRSVFLDTDRIPALVWRIRRPEPGAVIREQRREFVRVPAVLPVRLDYASEAGPKQHDVYTRDISGGGLALLVPRQVVLLPGMLVNVKFTLPNGNFPVDAKCLVVRVTEPNDEGMAVASLQFMNISEPVRQRIIQFTFWRQRMLTR